MRRAAAVLGFVMLLALTMSAQREITTVTIPFDFVAMGKTMPAGHYRFMAMTNDAIEITNMQNRASVIVDPLARIAATDHPKTLVTFDVVGNKYVLESLMPAGQDGYLVGITKEKHTHHVVKAG